MVKTAVSMPDPLFREAEQVARRLGLSRSALVAQAVRSFVAKHRRSKVTESLNRVYPRQPSAADPAFSAAMAEVLRDEGW